MHLYQIMYCVVFLRKSTKISNAVIPTVGTLQLTSEMPPKFKLAMMILMVLIWRLTLIRRTRMMRMKIILNLTKMMMMMKMKMILDLRMKQMTAVTMVRPSQAALRRATP